MTLTLLAVSLNDRELSQPITAHFDGNGGTIGRADHNTMALPDPERHVSRLQAEIVAHAGGTFLIRNVGAANPIVVGGRVVGRSETAPLNHGDEVRIGGYLLQVDCRTKEAALEVTRGRALRNAGLTPPAARPRAPPTPPTPPSAPSSPSPISSTPLAATTALAAAPAEPRSPGRRSVPAPAAGGNPFADLLLPATPSRAPPQAAQADMSTDPFADLMSPPAGVPEASGGLAPRPSSDAPAARLPDDFDLFAPAAPPLGAAPPARSIDPFADLLPSAPPPSIDALLGGTAEGDDPLAHFLAPAPGGSSPAGGAGRPASGVSTDPMQALFGDIPAPSNVAPGSDHVPALQGAFHAPRARPPAASPPPPLSAPPPPPATRAAPHTPPRPAAPTPVKAAHADDGLQIDRAWSAFCSGAGIAVPPHPNGSEEGLREAGRLLRSAVDGALRLIAVRASTKHELRAAVTVIQARDNNPLKFSPEATSALEVLLQPSVRGFLGGPAAMDDAMHDLVGHSIGTVAGMRAAIDGMLDRFAPTELEAKLVGRSMFDNVLPGTRKAKLWDLYVQHHGAIREEAQEDFHTLFGKAFLVAYEQQIEQLRRQSRGPNAQTPEPAEPEDQ